MILTSSDGTIFNAFGATLDVTLSRFFNNTVIFGADGIASFGIVTAENNWWGCDGFPGAPGCGSNSGTVDSDPRIDLTLDLFSSAPILVGDDAFLAVDATTNSDGESLGLLSAMDGVIVTFDGGGLGSFPPPGCVAVLWR